ncbi:hypothetical protein DR62_07615 [Burkholderia thailandensis]|nr:hypothetical protein DR62_07615 [Burkholderia thailandensis]AOI55191.1 hypothetical protein WI24_25825 [Burkholderia thailandensis]AOJ54222.1 hypothetical protein AQ475_25985 [Burkholderia thailandensis]AVR27622.1 hypothetical protein A8H32_21600 [Burkholderia thailandensis]PJO73603.1 hypothetical protein CWD92_02735 [Burkholderia thailandensis]
MSTSRVERGIPHEAINMQCALLAWNHAHDSDAVVDEDVLPHNRRALRRERTSQLAQAFAA